MKFILAIILSSIVCQAAVATSLSCSSFAAYDLEALVERAEILYSKKVSTNLLTGKIQGLYTQSFRSLDTRQTLEAMCFPPHKLTLY